MKVCLIAWTEFQAPPESPFVTDASEGQALAEYAGRACYQSWSRPNPKTATNAGYLAHILETGHFSVLEHASATFDFSEVSRALTHELIRHRHFSVSQLSQRYVPQGDARFVVPDVIAEDSEASEFFTDVTSLVLQAYELLRERLAEKFGEDSTAARKAARQAARYVLPNATATQIIVTGNYRAWRHFIALRATEAADVEIRKLAIAVLKQLQAIAPNVFGDFTITKLDDGTEVAASPYAERS